MSQEWLNHLAIKAMIQTEIDLGGLESKALGAMSLSRIALRLAKAQPSKRNARSSRAAEGNSLQLKPTFSHRLRDLQSGGLRSEERKPPG
ncbi:hypothetical protein GJ744_009452 [Endocarpon pusillum]|uniref:Uncharacterized protein n=1 Tax=Endocarpon pusillum TaxID=364733 RepID=A0A8H7AI49_9EURO|nr:hypothetical protein GJ744_009452 [Endocarpon pusillum]